MISLPRRISGDAVGRQQVGINVKAGDLNSFEV